MEERGTETQSQHSQPACIFRYHPSSSHKALDGHRLFLDRSRVTEGMSMISMAVENQTHRDFKVHLAVGVVWLVLAEVPVYSRGTEQGSRATPVPRLN